MRVALHLLDDGVVDVGNVAVREAVVPVEPVREAVVRAEVLQREPVADVPVDHERSLLVVELLAVVAGRQTHDVGRVGAADVIARDGGRVVVLRGHERPTHAGVVDARPVVGPVERLARGRVNPGHRATRVVGEIPVPVRPRLVYGTEAGRVVVRVPRHAVARVTGAVGIDRMLPDAGSFPGDAVSAVAEVALAVGAPVVDAQVERHAVDRRPLQDEREVLVVQVLDVLGAREALDGRSAEALHARHPVSEVVRDGPAHEPEPLVGVVLAEHGADVRLETLVVGLVGDVVHHAADRVPPIQGPLRSAQHFDPADVVQPALGGGDAEVRRIDAVVVGADPRVPSETAEVAPDAADLDVPVGTRRRGDEVHHFVRTLHPHVPEEVLVHGGDGDGGVRNGGFHAFAVDHHLFDTALFGRVIVVVGEHRRRDQEQGGQSERGRSPEFPVLAHGSYPLRCPLRTAILFVSPAPPGSGEQPVYGLVVAMSTFCRNSAVCRGFWHAVGAAHTQEYTGLHKSLVSERLAIQAERRHADPLERHPARTNVRRVGVSGRRR